MGYKLLLAWDIYRIRLWRFNVSQFQFQIMATDTGPGCGGNISGSLGGSMWHDVIARPRWSQKQHPSYSRGTEVASCHWLPRVIGDSFPSNFDDRLLKKTDRPAPVQFTAFQQQVLQMVHVQLRLSCGFATVLLGPSMLAEDPVAFRGTLVLVRDLPSGPRAPFLVDHIAWSFVARPKR